MIQPRTDVPNRILVVDDDEDVRQFFRKVLETDGYQIVEAADGVQATAMAANEDFHLIIIDLVMPNREGIETICILRKNRPEVRILAVSGAFGGSMLRCAAMLGADATLVKPIRPEDLVVAVRRLLA